MLRLACILLSLLVASCNQQAQIEADREKFGRISLSRPPGSACSASDSASIQRRSSHPLGPTGGWDSTALSTPDQTPYGTARGLMAHHNYLTGFVQFEEAGELKVRSYDDTYGSVYCGWSKAKLPLAASKKPTLVRFGRCAVGDGGLDQVHEVCWFAAGKTEGKIIYSSAHPAPTFNPVDLYSSADLGNRIYFNDRLAFSTIEAALKLGRVPLAEQIVKDSFGALERLENLVDGASGKPILARQYYRELWVRLMAMRLGLSLGKPEFSQHADALAAELAPNLPYPCNSCSRLGTQLSKYRELNTLKGPAAKAYFEQHFARQPQEFEAGARAVLFTN